jgi:serine/threonine protein phosphatase PrpC
MIPKFLSEDCSFCGVFDGTVGDDASEYINKNMVGHLCQHLKVFSEDDDNFIAQASKAPRAKDNNGNGNGDAAAASGGGVSDEIAERLRDGMRQAFLSCDGAFLEEAARHKLHYASSTGVAAFLWRNLLTVAHIGDSKACIARMVGNEIHPEWLTVDHKPNMPLELRRIEASGGSLAWLHGNKPYIRGGDFFKRQALGEHPKQLNYSRAFGGKDLKNFGLSAEPDISHFETTADDRLVRILFFSSFFSCGVCLSLSIYISIYIV